MSKKIFGNRFPETDPNEPQVVQVGSSGGSVLKEDLIATVSISGSGIVKGDEFPKGTDLEELWRKSIAYSIPPSITGLQLDGTMSVYESNVLITITSITINWSKGSGDSDPSYFIFNGVSNSNLRIEASELNNNQYILPIQERLQVDLGALSESETEFTIEGFTFADDGVTSVSCGTASDSVLYQYKMYSFSSELETLVGSEQTVINGISTFDNIIGGNNTSSVTVIGDGITSRYNWICYPSIWGLAKFYDGPYEMNNMVLDNNGSISVNINGSTVNYNAYRSPYKYKTNATYGIERITT